MLAGPEAIESARLQIEGDPGMLRSCLVFAAGAMAGDGMAGAAAAVLIALDRLCPEHDLKIDGWRGERSPCP